jgi:hypothetical protein
MAALQRIDTQTRRRRPRVNLNSNGQPTVMEAVGETSHRMAVSLRRSSEREQLSNTTSGLP